MDCSEALTLLSGRLDGENTAEEERALQEHLDACPDCRAILEAYQAIDRGVSALAGEPPEALARGVMEAVRRPVKKRRFYYGGGTLAAAALIALILFGPFSRRDAANSPPPSESAASYEEDFASMRSRSVEAQFVPPEEPALVEITDRAEAPVVERVALLSSLPSVTVDGSSEYAVDAATAREIIAACPDYAVSVPEGFSQLEDGAPVTVRITKKGE